MKKTIKILGILMVMVFVFGCTNHQNESKKSILNNSDSIGYNSDSIGYMSPCMFRGRSLGDTILPSIKNHTNLSTYVMTIFKYPKSAKDNKIEGKIFTQLTVDENGNVNNIQILRGLTDDCNNEAIRVIKTISWNPATVKGTPVKFTFVIPMNLLLVNKK